tara:strand:- start:295 stop:495 length:201 start_codon:yes stop_codon:yes gene_type:complete
MRQNSYLLLSKNTLSSPTTRAAVGLIAVGKKPHTNKNQSVNNVIRGDIRSLYKIVPGKNQGQSEAA